MIPFQRLARSLLRAERTVSRQFATGKDIAFGVSYHPIFILDHSPGIPCRFS
jgi:hypothetical protein